MNGKRPAGGGKRQQGESRGTDPQSLLIRSQKLGLTRSPAFTQVLEMLQLNPHDSQLQEFVMDAVVRRETIEIYSPDPNRATNPASPEDLPGSITLGIIEHTGVRWQITPEILTNHMAILGRSGGGKTNLILLILVQLLEMRRNA